MFSLSDWAWTASPGPTDRRDHIALGQVLDEIVAGEAADLPVVDVLLDLVDRVEPVLGSRLLGVDPSAAMTRAPYPASRSAG